MPNNSPSALPQPVSPLASRTLPVFNLPNILTSIRILLVPILVVVLLTKFDGREFVGLALFLLAALTDFLDGWIARRWGLITPLGKLLDPAADKILTSAAFISLVELGRAPAWIVVTIIAREFAISTLRSFAAAEQVIIPASWSGKVKTTVQVVAISLLIFWEQMNPFFRSFADFALIVALVISVYSGIEYGFRYAKAFFDHTPRPTPPAQD